MNSPKTMQRDFKSPLFEHKEKRQRKHQPLLVGGLSLVVTAVLVITLPSIATATRSLLPKKSPPTDIIETLSRQNNIVLELPETNQAPEAVDKFSDYDTPKQEAVLATQSGKWHTQTIKRGDSLSTVFERIGLPPTQLYAAMATGDVAKNLKQVHPGDQLKIYTSQDNQQLRGLVYQLSETRRLEIAHNGDILTSKVIETPIDRRIAHATGTISSSLFLASQRVGLSDNLTMELANLFGWDIDFALDIREGDQFSIIYEELYAHGEKLRDGNILAAEFINQNKSYRAIRFTNDKNQANYFTPEGDSVRKAFLRTPVDFSRISSRFSLHRKHPKLNTIRAHKGVDYAAKRGTPVRATGDGKIILRGNKGGYGRTIIIQHGSKYSTLYAHLNNYARGPRTGSTVKQGQVIGYVGSTGLATGPHLHYEFRVNGTHRNPLTVKLPDAAPLPKKDRIAFDSAAFPLLTQLDTLKRTSLALNNQ